MPINTFLILIWLHFVADFLLQSNEMALNKSTNNKWLAAHCLIYSLSMLYFGWGFAVINGTAHFLVDWLTSRGTSYFWKKEKRRAFFNLIGLDQAIHISILMLSWSLYAK